MQVVERVNTEAFELKGYLYMHRAIRQDIDNLEMAIGRSAKLSREDAVKLEKWFQFFWEMVESHHVGEDTFFFLEIAKRDKTFEKVMTVLMNDHQELHHLVEEMGNKLSDLQNTTSDKQSESTSRELLTLIRRFKELMNGHLDREEVAVITSVTQHFSIKEQKALEDEVMKRSPTKHLALLVPWVASALTAEETAEALKGMPLPLRIMYRLSWKKKYEKFTAVFRA